MKGQQIPSCRFDLREASGALGDIGTLLPLMIGAIALVSEITPGAIVLSGVLIGLVPLALGASGLIDKLARLVPQSVLSGLQLGLGMALGWIALGLMTDHVGVGIVSLGVAVAALRFGAGLLVLALVPDPLRQIVLMSIPMTTLGALLLIASVELAASQRLIDARPSCRPVMAVTALGTVLGTPLTGLILGTLAEIVRKRILRHATNAFR